MAKHLLTLAAATLLATLAVMAQETFPVNGTLEKDLTTYVLDGVTIHVSPDETLHGSLAWYKGKIIEVGPTIADRPNMLRSDGSGYHLYPSFIDLWSDAGMPETPQRKREHRPQDLSDKKGAFGWNEAIRPEVRAAELYSAENRSEHFKKMRNAGFGVVLTHAQDGIIRGSGALTLLDDRDNLALLRSEAAAFASFRKGSSTQDYPSSLMGSIALLRQTFYDADWYASGGERREYNLSLEAFNRIRQLPWFFECSDKLDVLRADKLGKEFGVTIIFKDGGDSYHRIDAIAETGGALIVSLDFPEALDVTDPYLARLVSINELKHWEMAPLNPVFIYRAGIPFAFTADGLKEPSAVLANLRNVIAHGLPEAEALRALTETPARLIGAEELIGHLSAGKLANFILTDGELFDDETRIFEHYVNGKKHVLIDRQLPDLSGRYDLTMNGFEATLFIKGKPGKYRSRLEVIKNSSDTVNADVTVHQDGDLISLKIGPLDSLFTGSRMLSGNCFSDSRIMKGSGQDEKGDWFTWAAVRSSDHDPRKNGKKPEARLVPESLMYPFTAYGRATIPEEETLLIKNATVWTCDEQGIIENGQVLIHKGKIVAVGKALDAASFFGREQVNVSTYDAKGMHVTPGIIDEHSHIAISRGVNEGTQASSAEVSIASVVTSEDVNIYRQLSGGVTAAQLLHGSANPIGGQSAVIKLRWGATPEAMQIEGADPFIKFALGENVKQANWGENYSSRFPQSRMGVEQVYYDLFIRAREYGEEWAAFNELQNAKRRKGDPQPVAPRRDLELETILQIVNSERFISCHSYRQDEINMLIHVADSMGFTVNTFTHILEGYKVADKMKKHGAGGSSFSDWWAYKFEVKDAIPYNGAILWSQGVVTAFNSDDSEMARRLNQEAAKAVKYGNVPEEEALKFVTLNPAKLLHLDHRTGSLTPGKDADLVIWNNNPLSIYARAEATFVDGRRLFDREDDQNLRHSMKAERARLVQKMIDADGGSAKKPTEKVPQHYHCDTITEENR